MTVDEIASEIAYTVESDTEVEIQAEVIEVWIYVALVALLIVAVGIGISLGPYVGVPFSAVTRILGIVLGMSSLSS